jgi:hypothetical protein
MKILSGVEALLIQGTTFCLNPLGPPVNLWINRCRRLSLGTVSPVYKSIVKVKNASAWIATAYEGAAVPPMK